MELIELNRPVIAALTQREEPAAASAAARSATRQEWIDIARGIAILLVIVGHSGISGELQHFLQPFRMPLFYITTGYLFNYQRHRDALMGYLGQRSRRLLLPYFVTAFFFLMVSLVVNQVTLHHQVNTPVKQFLAIFIGNATTLNGGSDYTLVFDIPLWFLACMTSASVIFIAQLHAFRHERTRLCLVISSLVTALCGFLIGRRAFLPWNFDVAMVAQFFMVIGLLLRENAASFADRRIFVMFLVAYVCLSFSGNFLDLNTRHYNDLGELFVAGLTGTYIVYFLSRQLLKMAGGGDAGARWFVEVLGFFGRNTMVIMAFHFGGSYLLTLINHFCLEGRLEVTEHPPLMFTAMLAASLTAVWVVSRVQGLRAIYYK